MGTENKFKAGLDQVKGEAKEKWGKLTDDESKVAEGKMDKAKGKFREGVEDVKEDVKKSLD